MVPGVMAARDAHTNCVHKRTTQTQTAREPLSSAGGCQIQSESRWILISCRKQSQNHLINSKVANNAFTFMYLMARVFWSFLQVFLTTVRQT